MAEGETGKGEAGEPRKERDFGAFLKGAAGDCDREPAVSRIPSPRPRVAACAGTWLQAPVIQLTRSSDKAGDSGEVPPPHDAFTAGSDSLPRSLPMADPGPIP